MNAHITFERMHDLVDGLVPASEEALLREHLGGCPECREELGALEATVGALRALPVAGRVPDGVWRGIEARIGAQADRSSDSRVLQLPVSRSGRRRFSLSVPQLAAAAVVVSLLSATVVWTVLAGGNVGGGNAAGGSAAGLGGEMATAAEGGPSARVVALGDRGYDEAVSQLQTLIDQGRDVLSPETLTTLEASLRTIDDAIAEVRVALASDPSSELLARLLANHQQSKLRVLRQAAISVQPRS
jgi:anti-sigma factor RsiW